jgi:nicotinamidase-related amidase
MANAVVVIDMVRGFFEEGYSLYLGSQARRIIPDVQKLLEAELAKGSKILFLCDNHDPDDLEFEVFPRHCVAGTVETEIIPELRGYPGEIIPKKRYSAFFGSTLDSRLKELAPEKIIVCGVCTDICVMHTVANARNRDYQVEVPVELRSYLQPEGPLQRPGAYGEGAGGQASISRAGKAPTAQV